MDKEAIKKLLPHREPMLLVENAAVDADGWATGSYTVKSDEFFLQGHFPGNPVVPGVILCEMMAQTCCVLLGEQAADPGKTPFFTSLDKVKFKNPVRPGDVFESRCRIVRTKGPFYFCEGEGRVAGKLCTSASFSFALVDNKG